MEINPPLRALFLCVLLLAAFSFTSPRTLPQSDTEKVSLALYYESLCPYSAKFIIDHLNKLVSDDEMMKIIDLKLVPYGNAEISNGTIYCQHGEWECVLNKIEACAMDVYPSLGQHFPFINCVEEYAYKENETYFYECFDKVGMNTDPIIDCYNNGRGDHLEFQYANETSSLQPPHEYVPWVTVNGEPLYEEYENFIAYICKAYKGTDLPKACKSLPSIAVAGNQYKNDGRHKNVDELKSCKRGA